MVLDMASSTKIEFYVYCASCEEVFDAREEVQYGVCPKCGTQGFLDAPCTWPVLPECTSKWEKLDKLDGRTWDQMPEVGVAQRRQP